MIGLRSYQDIETPEELEEEMEDKRMSFEEWWKSWTVKDWNDIESAKGLFQQAYEAGLHADVHTDNSKVISELENKIADIKANCDLAIEGRDVKVMELEKENERLTVSYETLKLHDEEEIEDWKADSEHNLELMEGLNNRISELEKENAELRNNGFTVSAMTEQQLKVALKKGEQLEKENAELKERVEKAEDLIEDMYDKIPTSHSDYYKDVMERAKQFLKEIEK